MKIYLSDEFTINVFCLIKQSFLLPLPLCIVFNHLNVINFRLVEKIRHSEDMDLKRVLFSLKTFFQSDKDLVYEFVKEGGLLLLIDLGEDEEAQLQNLILRALGQIMLYVDGMNGVMENPRAIQFLYKLVLASNPLVCKTAIKLLLVFVEYTENNCLLLIKAINEVDKELGVIPWSNIITTIQNANKDSSKRIGN